MSRTIILPPHIRGGKEKDLFKKALRFFASKKFFKAFYAVPFLLAGSCDMSLLPIYSANAAKPVEVSANIPPVVRVAPAVTTVAAVKAAAQASHGYLYKIYDMIKNNPKEIKKLTQEEIAELFGVPALARRDADAKVWQYKTASCVIDFYFYGKGDQKDTRVSYFDMRLKGKSSIKSASDLKDQTKCLSDVVASKQGGDNSNA